MTKVQGTEIFGECCWKDVYRDDPQYHTNQNESSWQFVIMHLLSY